MGTGLLKVIDALGLTITELEQRLERATARITELEAQESASDN